MSAMGLAASIAGWAAVLLCAPLMQGMTEWTKARLAGRSGADPFQPYRTMRKLLRKESLAPTASTPLFWAGPLFSTAAVMLAIVGVLMAAGTPRLRGRRAVIAPLLLSAVSVLAGLTRGRRLAASARRASMVAALEPR
jgi:formate hydrogenlyase subunit 4